MSKSLTAAPDDCVIFDTTDLRSEIDTLRLELHQFVCQTKSRLAAITPPGALSSSLANATHVQEEALASSPDDESDLVRSLRPADAAQVDAQQGDVELNVFSGNDRDAEDPLNRLEEIKRRLAERLQDI